MLGVLAWCGCGRRAEVHRPEPLPPDAVCILQPAVSNEFSGPSATALARIFPEAMQVAMDEGDRALAECRDGGRVLVVPQARDLPVWYWPVLTNHMALGGRVLFWGTDPFRQRYEAGRDGYLTGASFAQLLSSSAVFVPELSSVQRWLLRAADGGKGGTMRVDLEAPVPWPAVQVDVTNLVAWNAVVRENLPAGAIPQPNASLAFFLRGDANLTRIAVECEEDDGSHWSYLAPVGTTWRLTIVHEREFAHDWGGAGRGGQGDHLSLSRARRLSIGLSMHLAPQSPGPHTFGLSDVRVLEDPRFPDEVAAWPDLPLVSPPYRHFDLEPRRIELQDGGRRVDVRRPRVQSPLPRPTGTGGRAGLPSRWMPLARAFGGTGDLLGWPLSAYVEADDAGQARAWAWLAMDPYPDTLALQESLLEQGAARLHAGWFIVQAGVPRMEFQAGQQFNVAARVARGGGPVEGPVRVVAELIEENGEATRRVAAPVPEEAVGQWVDLNLGGVPPRILKTRDLRIRVSLWDAEDKRRHDVLEQSIRLRPQEQVADRLEWMAVTGSGFTQGRRPVHLFGVNYWPRSAVGRAPGEARGHWLDVGEFDLDLVRRDLDRLQEAGINSLAIQYLDERQAPQLRCLLDELRTRNMWVHLFVNHLSPLDQDLAAARRLIEAADLARQPVVCSIDLAWEPHLGPEASRRRMDEAWRAWLAEQYGSIEHAERVIGRELWRHDGVVTGPPDAELAEDEGDHRVAVAAYRRFADDWISRRYGEVRRFLADLGCRQLLAARSGYGGSGNRWGDTQFPIDLASGAVHLDFISPEAWGLTGDPRAIQQAGFISAYARGVSGGKPVVWTEYGTTVGEAPEPADLQRQAALYSNLHSMFIRSQVAGSFAWWFPGGWRVDERSDMGVVHPDGRWRPVGDVLRGFNQRLRREQSAPQPWRGREMSRSAHARGLSGLWDEWRSVYGQETAAGRLQEIRPAGFGRFSRELPMLAVGGVPFVAPAPLEYLNAEWGSLAVAGERRARRPEESVAMRVRESLEAELINTGPATWSTSVEGQSGSVWLLAQHPRAKDQKLVLRNVAFGDRCTVTWSPTDTGTWELRAWMAGAGSFGEPLIVHVRDADAPAKVAAETQ